MSQSNFTKTATVLGASGNIGRLLVPYLVEQGYKVKAVGRSAPKYDSPSIQNIAADYNNLDELTAAMQGSAITFMLVGLEYNLKIWQTEWPPLVQKMIEAAKITKTKFVFFDNVYAYGHVVGTMTESTPMQPSSQKGQVRKHLDELILKAIEQDHLPAVIAKAADFYGPGITTSIMGDRFFNQAIKSGKVEWFGDPNKFHSLTYTPDIAPALLKLGESDFVGNIHLPTAKPPINGHETMAILQKSLGKPLKLAPLGKTAIFWLKFVMPVLGEFNEMFYQYENDYSFDSSLIEKQFPDLMPTPYETGLSNTLKYFEGKIG